MSVFDLPYFLMRLQPGELLMPFWPFKKSEPEQLTPVELRDKLIQAAATASKRKLHSLCEQYKQQVADNVEFLAKVPEETQSNEASTNQYVQALIAVVQCLVNECHSPKLWQQIASESCEFIQSLLVAWSDDFASAFTYIPSGASSTCRMMFLPATFLLS